MHDIFRFNQQIHKKIVIYNNLLHITPVGHGSLVGDKKYITSIGHNIIVIFLINPDYH